MNRKDFLKTTGLGYLAFCKIPVADYFINNHGIELGLITNIIEKEIQLDWKQALLKVAQTGYKYLEFSRINNVPRDVVKGYLNEIGLKPLSGGSALAALKREDELKRLIDDSLFYGKEYLVCYWPWLDNGDNKTLDDFRRAGEELNKIGEKCNAQGIRFAFHNHNKEFVKVEGDCWGYDVIVRETEPSAVCMLLDLYWASKGGADIISLFKKYPGRFEMLHLKDMDNTPQKDMTCPGNGIIDFPAIFRHTKKAGVKYFIVEVDQNPDPFGCIKESYDYLKKISVS